MALPEVLRFGGRWCEGFVICADLKVFWVSLKGLDAVQTVLDSQDYVDLKVQ